MKSKWNIYRLCTEPDQRRGLFGESQDRPPPHTPSCLWKLLLPPPLKPSGLIRGIKVTMYIYWLTTIWCVRKHSDSLQPLTWGEDTLHHLEEDSADSTQIKTVCCEFWPAVPWKRRFIFVPSLKLDKRTFLTLDLKSIQVLKIWSI